MREHLASIFSYLFMIAAVAALISAFTLIVIGLRYFMESISQNERQIAFYLSVVLIASVILSPIFHYISHKLDLGSRRMEEV